MNKKLNLIHKSWAFNRKVSLSFDKHVTQSVPFYTVFQKDVAKYSEWFLKDEALIYDLGCSTGQTIKYITKLGTSTNINIRGIDNSKTMIKLAKEKLKNINAKNINIELSVADVNKIQIEKCNLIYSILLMPFLSKNQINLIEKVSNL